MGNCLKRGLGQFADLRGACQERGRWCFWRGGGGGGGCWYVCKKVEALRMSIFFIKDKLFQLLKIIHIPKVLLKISENSKENYFAVKSTTFINPK